MICLMGVLTSIISWVICVFAVLASIGITVVLWATYFDIRKTQDSKIKYSYFDEFLRNETAIYAMAIIATVIMVKLIFILCGIMHAPLNNSNCVYFYYSVFSRLS